MHLFKNGIADYIKTELPDMPNWLTYPLMELNQFRGLCYGPTYMKYGSILSRQSNEERLIAIVNYAIEHVAYYRERYGNLRIHSLAEFEEKIGYIDKDTVVAHWDKFVADGVDLSKCSVGTTGGTSGKPLKLVMPRNRYIHSSYFWHRQLREIGWNYDKMAVLRNYKLPASRLHKINPIMRQVIFDGFRTDKEYYNHIWHTMKRLRIKYIYAYPSAAYGFLKHCHSTGLDTSFIRGCMLTSESITENQRYLISEQLHIPISASYGHSEKLSSAHTSHDAQQYHIDEEYGLTELVDNSGKKITNNGILGEIVGTTYFNRQFPLIRYRTGDFSSFAATSTNESRVLDGIEGRREKNMIYKADGTFTTITALDIHSDVYERISGLQYIQEERGKLKALIIKDDNYTDADHEYIYQHLANAMSGGKNVEIQYVSKLIYQPNGKFLPFISKIDV